MTIKFLAAYGPYEAGAIGNLDPATEAGLIAQGQASAILAGGVYRYRDVGTLTTPYDDTSSGPVTLQNATMATISLRRGHSLSITADAGFRGRVELLNDDGSIASSIPILEVGNYGPFATNRRIRVYADIGPITYSAGQITRANTSGQRGNRLATMGDSITAFGSFGTAGACTASGTTITVSHSNHAMTVGQAFIAHLSAPTDAAYHGIQRVATVIDKDTFTYVTKTAPSILSSTVQICLPRTTTVESWWEWMNQLGGKPFDVVVNAGIGSNTTDQMLARLDTDVIAFRPDFCTLMGGTNDIRSALNGAPRIAAIDSAFANIKAMCVRLISAGITPILCTVLPVRAAHVDFATVTSAILALNNKIRTFALTTPGIILADTFQSIVDPAQTNNAAKDAWLVDDVHLNGPGAFRVGRYAWKAVSKFAPNPQPLVASNGDVSTTGTNRMPNPQLVATGGRLNGVLGNANVPANFAVAKSGNAGATLTPALVDRTFAADGDTDGKNFVMTFAGVDDNDAFTFSRDVALPAYVAGDVAVTDFILKFENAVNLKHCQITFTVNVNGSNHQVYVWAGTTKGFPNEDFTVTIRTRDFIMPTDSGNIALSIAPTFGAGGSLKLTIAKPRIGLRLAAA